METKDVINKEDLKSIFKEAIIEVLETRKDILEEALAEALEDIAMLNAIREGEKGDYVDEKTFMNDLRKKINES